MKFLNYGKSKQSRKLGINPYSKRKIPPAHLQGDINQKKFTLEVSGVFPRETKKKKMSTPVQVLLVLVLFISLIPFPFLTTMMLLIMLT